MTTDRHLALMALMREIENPSKAYYRSVGQAGRAFTDSVEWQRAVGRGNAALDAIETTVRMWVESNRPQAITGRCGTPSPDGRFVCALEPHNGGSMHADRPDAELKPGGRQMVWETPVVLPASFERITGLTVKCAACGYGYDEDEGTQLFDSISDATEAVVSAGWGELTDGRVLCEEQDDDHESLRKQVGVVAQDATEEQPAVEACGKCRHHFDPADKRFDGRARYRLTPYCRGCVDRCHDTEVADHRCVICA